MNYKNDGVLLVITLFSSSLNLISYISTTEITFQILRDLYQSDDAGNPSLQPDDGQIVRLYGSRDVQMNKMETDEAIKICKKLARESKCDYSFSEANILVTWKKDYYKRVAKNVLKQTIECSLKKSNADDMVLMFMSTLPPQHLGVALRINSHKSSTSCYENIFIGTLKFPLEVSRGNSPSASRQKGMEVSKTSLQQIGKKTEDRKNDNPSFSPKRNTISMSKNSQQTQKNILEKQPRESLATSNPRNLESSTFSRVKSVKSPLKNNPLNGNASGKITNNLTPLDSTRKSPVRGYGPSSSQNSRQKNAESKNHRQSEEKLKTQLRDTSPLLRQKFYDSEYDNEDSIIEICPPLTRNSFKKTSQNTQKLGNN